MSWTGLGFSCGVRHTNYNRRHAMTCYTPGVILCIIVSPFHCIRNVECTHDPTAAPMFCTECTVVYILPASATIPLRSHLCNRTRWLSLTHTSIAVVKILYKAPLTVGIFGTNTVIGVSCRSVNVRITVAEQHTQGRVSAGSKSLAIIVVPRAADRPGSPSNEGFGQVQ